MTQHAPPEPTDQARHELCVVAELDVHTVPDLDEQGIRALTDPAVRTLALNLSEVTFIDSTGIGTLVRLRLAADERHKHLVLSQPSDPVRRLLTLTALTAAFTIDDAPAPTQTSST